jgi:hypothetical protein
MWMYQTLFLGILDNWVSAKSYRPKGKRTL